MKAHPCPLALLFALAVTPALWAQNVTLHIVNNNPDIPDPYITFVQSVVADTSTYEATGDSSSSLLGPALAAVSSNATILQNGIAYQLSAIGSTITFAPNWAGNIFFSNAPLALGGSGQSANNTLNPTPPPTWMIPQLSQAPFLPTNPNGANNTDTRRFNYIELSGGSATAIFPDITYINYYSVPIQLTRVSDGATRGAPTSMAAFAALPEKLSLLSGNSSTVVVNDAGGIARIISPDNGTAAAAAYASFAPYIASSFSGNATPINLTNNYTGVMAPPNARYEGQTYTGSSVTYDGTTLVITGSSNNTDIGAYTLTWTGNASALSEALYLAVLADYDVTYATGSFSGGNTGDNDVFSAITRDLLAGFNFGFINSQTAFGNSTIGALPSSEWMTLSYAEAFANAQPDDPFYNVWAAAFAEVYTDVYTFPFNDFFGGSFAPVISVNTGDTLVITLLGIPEPTTTGLLLATAALALGARRRRALRPPTPAPATTTPSRGSP